MPARSKAQQRLMGACEHGADWASCPKGMSKQQMHDFAATKTAKLPNRVGKASKSKGKHPNDVWGKH